MTLRVPIGPLSGISERSCRAVCDGEAVVLRIGDEVRAYRNRCLHQDAPLEGGWVRDGVLSCPLHFWRYRVDDGTLVGGERQLDRFAVEVVDGEVFVIVPDPPPERSLREQLLDRARDYDRDREFERRSPR